MSWDTLEKIFVARHNLLSRIMDRVEEAGKSRKRNHTLLVGSRGSGKTHLVALAYHRAKSLIAAGSSLQVSWLPEDPYSIKSYRRLLASILERVEGQDAREYSIINQELLSENKGNERELESILESQLINLASKQGAILVIVENLDQILHAIGRIGQERFRNLLQSSTALLILATTTRLDRSLSYKDSPFYEFFSTVRLEPFTVEEAKDMLIRVAELDDNQELVSELASKDTKIKLQVIAHLAGGQPRLWSVLASSLTVSELDDLVDFLLTRFDDMTAYYQERMLRLSDNQQLIVDELARSNHALNVSEIAQRIEVGERSAAKTISDLVDRGWLQTVTCTWAPQTDKRRTFYELAEPLARLTFQIKESRGEPLPLIIDFLKNWYSHEELDAFDLLGPIAEQYLAAALTSLSGDEVTSTSRLLSGLSADRVPAVQLLGRIDDALSQIQDGDSSLFLSLPTPIRTSLDHQLAETYNLKTKLEFLHWEIHESAFNEMYATPDNKKEIAHWLKRAQNIAKNDPAFTSTYSLALWQIRLRDFAKARATIDSLEEIVEQDSDRALVICVFVNYILELGNADKVTDSFSESKNLIKYTEKVLGEEHPAIACAYVVYSNIAKAHQALDKSQWKAKIGDLLLPLLEEISKEIFQKK